MLAGFALAAVGLTGRLSILTAILILVALAALGLLRIREAAQDLRRAATDIMRIPAGLSWFALCGMTLLPILLTVAWTATLTGYVPPPLGIVLPDSAAFGLACAVILLAATAFTVAILRNPRLGIFWLLATGAAVTFLAALMPPTEIDWDGLAEHLAQAKVYARTGAYAPLWHDHHSHFPALVQMLFTLGMLFNGPGLAKLFHWSFGMIALATVYCLGERFARPGSGKWAALTFATTPVIGWLMRSLCCAG